MAVRSSIGNGLSLLAFNRVGAAACLGLCLAAGSASGQVVPPPQEKPEPEPEYVRPEAPPIAPQRSRRTDINDSFDTVPYESLVKTDQFGRILPLDKPVDWAAMDENTLLRETDIENYIVVLERRVERLTQSNLDNLDVLIEIDSNGFIELIEGVGGGDEETEMRLQGIIEQIRPVMVTDSIHSEMVDAGMILNRQSLFTDHIAREYKGAVLDEARENFEPEPGSPVGPVDMMLRQAFYQQLDEPLFIYREMLGWTTFVAEDVIAGQLELTDETRGMLLRKVREMDAFDSLEGKSQVMRELLLDLGSGQRLKLFEAAIEARNQRNSAMGAD